MSNIKITVNPNWAYQKTKEKNENYTIGTFLSFPLEKNKELLENIYQYFENHESAFLEKNEVDPIESSEVTVAMPHIYFNDAKTLSKSFKELLIGFNLVDVLTEQPVTLDDITKRAELVMKRMEEKEELKSLSR